MRGVLIILKVVLKVLQIKFIYRCIHFEPLIRWLYNWRSAATASARVVNNVFCDANCSEHLHRIIINYNNCQQRARVEAVLCGRRSRPSHRATHSRACRGEGPLVPGENSRYLRDDPLWCIQCFQWMRWGCDVIFSKYISRQWTHVCVSRAEHQSWCTGSVLAVCCVGGEGCDERWPGQSWPGEWRVARCVSHSATRRQSSWPPSPWALTPAGSTTGDTRYIYFQNVARIYSWNMIKNVTPYR